MTRENDQSDLIELNILNRLQQSSETKKKSLKSLNALYDGIDDYGVNIEGGTVQVFFEIVLRQTRDAVS
jgi:hypothetical protein